jgi:hypothetical protein
VHARRRQRLSSEGASIDPLAINATVAKPQTAPRPSAAELGALLPHGGAREAWLVRKDGSVEMFDASGPIAASSFGAALASAR